MRYFSVLAWAGRLQQRDAAYPGTWDPARLRYESEESVDRILAMMPTDLKVRSPEDIDMALDASLGENSSRVLWILEDLFEVASTRVKGQGV